MDVVGINPTKRSARAQGARKKGGLMCELRGQLQEALGKLRALAGVLVLEEQECRVSQHGIYSKRAVG
jgi:hypothetical protein